MSSYDDYFQRNMMAQQAMTQQSLGGLSNQGYRTNPLDGYDIKSIPLSELERMLGILATEYDRRTMHTPMQGPTKDQLNKSEALKNAWDEYQIIAKLQGQK